jgi:hypothetical protein
MHELLKNPFTSKNVIEQAEKGGRSPEVAWEIARCLVLAGELEPNILIDFVVLGGLSDRNRHLDVKATLIPLLETQNEFALKLWERLWKALTPLEKETSHPEDISWGAARLLIESSKVATSPEMSVPNSETGTDWEKGEQLAKLLRVVAQQVHREPVAFEFFNTFANSSKAAEGARLALINLLDDEKPEVAFEAARCLVRLGDFEHLSLPVAIGRGLAMEPTQTEALQLLDKIRAVPSMAQAVRSALISAVWDKDEQVAWSAAAYLMDHSDCQNPGIPRGLIFGRRTGHYGPWRRDISWDSIERLQKLLNNQTTRSTTIDALFAGLYEKKHSYRFDLIALLVCAGAPLYDKVLARMADASRWEMAVAPLALLGLSGRAKEAYVAAKKMGIHEVAELIGEC